MDDDDIGTSDCDRGSLAMVLKTVMVVDMDGAMGMVTVVRMVILIVIVVVVVIMTVMAKAFATVVVLGRVTPQRIMTMVITCQGQRNENGITGE